MTLASALCLTSFSEASASEASPPDGERSAGSPASRQLQLLASLSMGRGLRFNNPFRLATPLGNDAESLSLSATYLELSLGGLLDLEQTALDGRLRHGVAVAGLLALDGIAQVGVTPSYLVAFDLSDQIRFGGRAGVPVALAPDTTLGLELAVGSSWHVAAGLGVTAELIGSVFFGAATEQSSVTTIPIVSAQLGVFYRYGVSL